MENDRKKPQRPNYFPDMTPGQRVLFIWGPVMLKWGISIAVSLLAGAMIALGVMLRDSKDIYNLANDQNALFEFAQGIAVKYTTPIEGAAAIVTIIVMLFYLRKDKAVEKSCGMIQNRKAPMIKYWMVFTMSALMSLALNNLILIADLNRYSEAYAQVEEALYSPGLLVQIVCLCILVPISEELVFRGIVYRRIRWESRASVAILYSAMIFAVVHGNLVQGIYGFLMGLLLGYLYEKFGSVLAPVIAHMTANLITVLASEYGFFEWEISDIRLIGVITVVCAVCSSIVYLLISAIDEKPEVI